MTASPRTSGLDQGALGTSDNNRRAKYYELTRKGRAQLEAEASAWRKLSAAIAEVLETASREDVLSDLLLRLRALFKGTAVDREIDEEPRFHVERHIESYFEQCRSRNRNTSSAQTEDPK